MIKIIEMFELHKHATDTILWISSNNLAKISHDLLYIIIQMFRQSTNQNHYPVFR